MTVTSRARGLLVVALLVASSSGCSNGEDTEDRPRAGVEFDFPARLEAPDRGVYSESSDTDPRQDDARVDLQLDSGASVVLWVDPDDYRKVWQQHSDPDDGDAWTKPELLYTAGTGCLFVEAVTDGALVAATLGCYAHDAFLQQAPDEGVAVVTTDLRDWQRHEPPTELWEEPSISGGVVSWQDGLRWSPGDGFTH